MPSWRPDTAKQRLWLGSDRYCSGRRDARTNTKCFAYSSINRYAVRRYDSNSDSDPNCDGDGNCDSDG